MPSTAQTATWSDKINALAGMMPPEQAQALTSLLPGAAGNRTGSGWRSPVPDPERDAATWAAPRPADDDPQALRSVGIVGGGTAGYLTALALKAQRPWLDVTLIESSKIPVIGVGEATTPPLMAFLHHYLGIDPADFWEKVKPTWKLGILFDWGRHADGIMAPFDWGANSIGVLGSLANLGHPNAFTLQSLFMLKDRVPVFRGQDGEYISLMPDIPFAYHLENKHLVKYLTDLAKARGIKHMDAEIGDITQSGPDWVESLRTKDGQELSFDLYIDCTGFRSMLLEKTLKSEYVSYHDTLITDTALTGYVPQTEAIGPYTRATTMNSGWCWRIPVPGEDHVGYVHSSEYTSLDEAAEEITRLHPEVRDLKPVKFRSGRHGETWRGNVIAMGNAYGFVEPLESSSLLMLIFTIMSMMPLLPASWKQPAPRGVLNEVTATRWDGLRWFLGIHYKYNSRADTPFWKEVRESADVSGIEPLLEVFAAGAPLHLRDPLTRRLARAAAPTFYELDGVDCMLIGQDYPCELLPSEEPPEAWHARKAAADALVERGLTQRQALEAFHTHPELIKELIYGQSSWVNGYGEQRWLQSSRA